MAKSNVKDAIYAIFQDKMFRETNDGLKKIISEGEALLPHKDALNARGTLKHGDMLVTMLKAARDERNRRKPPKRHAAKGGARP